MQAYSNFALGLEYKLVITLPSANVRYTRPKTMGLGPVVQSAISTNPGLNFNRLFWFMHFCSTVCFKILKTVSFIEPENILWKICSTSQAST